MSWTAREGVNRRIVLARRPDGVLVPDDLAREEGPVPEPGGGEVLVRNLLLSIDPAIRGWMAEGRSYIDPIPLGGAVRSGMLAQVVDSRSDRYHRGDIVVGLSAWEDYSVVSARMLGRAIPRGSPVPLPACLGVLGGNGLTAYFGLIDVGRPNAGETVLVSSAAGGVGSLVGQIAKLHGCRAVGIAGGPEKCRWLVDELGYDAAIDYRNEELGPALKRACPDGVDVYFDNVGGAMLDAVLMRINTHARVVLCGAISQLEAAGPPVGLTNSVRLLTRRARMEGFVTLDFQARWAEVSGILGGWVAEGQLRGHEEVVDGLEAAPEALIGLLAGRFRGKPLVRVADPI